MKPFRFVHAADLHLDSPFKGLRRTSAETAAALANATFEAFERIVDLCIDERVDALLVAGDIYDGADRSLRAQLAFRDGLERLDAAGIRSFICHGNHDPLDGWQARLSLPPGCHRFGPIAETVIVDDAVAIHGVSYATRIIRDDLASTITGTPAAQINIGLLHATVGHQEGHEPYAPCTLESLERRGIDYWALGHVHERQVLRDAFPAVVYPGNPQGRHLKEQGARGVYLVAMAPGAPPRMEFRAVDVARWARVELSIAGLETDDDLLAAATRALREAADAAEGRRLVAALRLTGRGDLHRSLAQPGFVDELQRYLDDTAGRWLPPVHVAAIEDRTAAPRDRVAGGNGFIADLCRYAESAATDPALLADLRHELSVLGAYGPARHHLGDIADGDLSTLLERALERSLDLLEEAPA